MLKNEPMRYATQVNSEGNLANIEIRLQILSSQHEGAFFKIRVVAEDTNKNNNMKAELYTNPIKAISKITQVKRKLESQQLEPSDPLPHSKRMSTDAIVESLNRLKDQQEEQSRLLNLLIDRDRNKTTAPNGGTPTVGIKTEDTETDEFEQALQKFLTAYRNLTSSTEKITKIQKVLSENSNGQGEELSNFIRTYAYLNNDFSKTNFQTNLSFLSPVSSPYEDPALDYSK